MVALLALQYPTLATGVRVDLVCTQPVNLELGSLPELSGFEISFPGEPPQIRKIQTSEVLYHRGARQKRVQLGQIFNPEVFSDSSATTLVICAGLAVEQGSRAGNGLSVHVMRKGWKSWKAFLPHLSFSALETATEREQELEQSAFSVSPDGATVMGQFCTGKNLELWKWDLDRSTPVKVSTVPMPLNSRVARYGFAWYEDRVYWTPVEGGPLYQVKARSIERILKKAPYLLDLKGRLAFDVVDETPSRKVAPYRWVNVEAAHLRSRKIIPKQSGKIALAPSQVYRNHWIFPLMPDFIVSPIGFRTYFVAGNDTTNNILIQGKLRTFKQGSYAHLVTKNRVISGAFSEDTFSIESVPYSLVEPTKKVKSSSILIKEAYSNRQSIFFCTGGVPLSTYFMQSGDSNMWRLRDYYYRSFPCSTNGESLYPLTDSRLVFRQEAPAWGTDHN